MNEIENTGCVAIGSTSRKKEPLAEMHIEGSGIYGLRCRVTDKWYVGQTKDFTDRRCRYITNRFRGQKKLFAAVKKYGIENFDSTILESVDSVDWILDYREMYWIRKLNTFVDGYNLTEGGQLGSGFLGRKHSDETKRKMSAARTGMKKSPESIAKLVRFLTGKKRSTETCAKISASRLGKKFGPLSERARENIRKSLIGHAVSETTRANLRAAAKLRKERQAIVLAA